MQGFCPGHREGVDLDSVQAGDGISAPHSLANMCALSMSRLPMPCLWAAFATQTFARYAGALHSPATASISASLPDNAKQFSKAEHHHGRMADHLWTTCIPCAAAAVDVPALKRSILGDNSELMPLRDSAMAAHGRAGSASHL